MINSERKIKIDTLLSIGKSFEQIIGELCSEGGQLSDKERVFLFNKLWERAHNTKIHQNELLTAQKILNYFWGNQFQVHCDNQEQAIFLRIDSKKQEVSQVSLRAMIQEAAKIFGGTYFDGNEKYLSEQVGRWSLDSKNQLKEMPCSFALQDYDGLTFNRIDIEVKEQSTPMFDQICNRIESNSEAMKAFFWSIFDRESSVDKYLWMTGDGQDGKGSLMRLLAKLLGDAYVGLSARNKWWPADCVGKRLGVFNDIVKTSFPMTSEVKQVTGGDRVTIERKYKDAVSITLDTKFIFTTNKPLNISGQKADLRRCIYIKFGKNTDDRTENFEKRLWEERAGILFKCREAYGKLSKEGSINCSVSLLKGEVEDFEMIYESLFERNFVVDPNSKVPRLDVFDTILKELNHNRRRYGDFKEWLKRTHGIVERKLTGDDGVRRAMFIGMREVTLGEHLNSIVVKD